MSAGEETTLAVFVGDIHGRFRRVQEWIAALEQAVGRGADVVLAVGDVEAFASAEDHRRKAVKRGMPAEFAEYVEGRAMARPLYFIGGNNEDFEALHAMPEGGELDGGAHYLGRAGVRTLKGLTVAYLSGILAPTKYELPLAPPTTAETHKQAGYFRKPEVESLLRSRAPVDLMLVHEWPKGLVRRAPGRTLRAYRFPWIGNAIAKQLVEVVRPPWLFAGHSHVPYAATVRHEGGLVTRAVCLDQAAKPEGSVFWLEWSGHRAVRGGWGISGRESWRDGDEWDDSHTPQTPPSDEAPDPAM